MADLVTNLDSILQSQSQKEVTANALFDAASPATLFGRHASACAGLTWGFYGGKFVIAGTPTSIANGTIALTASATCYVRVAKATGVVSFVTSPPSGWPGPVAGYFALYDLTTGPATVTGGNDWRNTQWDSTTAGTVSSVALTVPAEFSVSGSPITSSGTLAVTKATQSANLVFAGPTTGSAAAPTFRAVVAADIAAPTNRVHTYSFSSTVTAETDLYDTVEVTMTGPMTLNASGGVDGKKTTVRLRQDGTGSRVLTLGGMFRLSADVPSVILSTGASKLDYIQIAYNGTNTTYDVLALNRGF